MKTECLKDKFLASINIASKAVGKNQNFPILSCFLIKALKNSIIIRSTNLDIGIEVEIPAKVMEEGEVVVPASIISSFISNLGSEKSIFLEKEGDILKINSSKNKSVIKTFPGGDFPNIPQIESGQEMTIISKDFVEGLKAVWYSASISSIKPELSSVYIWNDNGDLVFVATDSFRLAEKRIKKGKLGDFSSILIPFKNVQEIIKVFEDFDGEISIVFDKNQITIKGNGIYLVSRIVNGVFPDYRQIIPKNFLNETILLKQDFINALKISVIFGDKFNQVNIKSSDKEGKLEIVTKNSDIGENKNILNASVSGEEMVSNFNYKYIMDCFQSIPTDSIYLGFGGPQKPLVIKGKGENSFVYLVMPMNR